MTEKKHLFANFLANHPIITLVSFLLVLELTFIIPYRIHKVEMKQKEQEVRQLAEKVSALTADLNAIQDTNLKFITTINSKNSETESLKRESSNCEDKFGSLQKLTAPQMALEPTWVKAGKAFMAFNEEISITVDESTDKGQCQQGPIAAVHLIGGNERNTLCLQARQPQTFMHKRKKYFLYLLKTRVNEQAHEYLVAIFNKNPSEIHAKDDADTTKLAAPVQAPALAPPSASVQAPTPALAPGRGEIMSGDTAEIASGQPQRADSRSEKAPIPIPASDPQVAEIPIASPSAAKQDESAADINKGIDEPKTENFTAGGGENFEGLIDRVIEHGSADRKKKRR